MKGLQRWAVLACLCLGIGFSLPAQQPVKTTKDRPVRTIQQPPVQIKTPVKVVPQQTIKTPPKQTEEVVPGTEVFHTDPPIDMAVDLEALNKPLIVSGRFTRTLHDNGTYIDERGLYGMTFDIIRKQDGNFALVYTTSSENPTLRTKAVLMTLNSELAQQGNAMIVTKPDEDVFDIRIKEFPGSILAIPYVCCDSRSDELNNHGEAERNYDLKALKYTQVNAGGVGNRAIDPNLGAFRIIDFFKNHGGGNVSVIYNHNGIGKIGLADPYFGSHTETCTLKPLVQTETIFYGSPPNSVQPKIISASHAANLLMYTTARLHTPVWNLDDKGLNSNRKLMPVWPLLCVNTHAVSNSHQGLCGYDNDPYTIYSDEALDLDDIVDAFRLSDGKLGVLEEGSSLTYFNVFDQDLSRLHDHAGLYQDIEHGSLQFLELGNSRILFLYKTTVKSGSGINTIYTDQYRATVYDWNIHDILWTGSEVLWEESASTKKAGDYKKHKLVQFDADRLLVVSFEQEDNNYSNQQTLEYRIITLNFD